MKLPKKVNRAVLISTIASICIGLIGAFLSFVQSHDFYDA